MPQCQQDDAGQQRRDSACNCFDPGSTFGRHAVDTPDRAVHRCGLIHRVCLQCWSPRISTCDLKIDQTAS